MAWTFTTSGAAVNKAGANASSINTSGSVLATWSNQSEGRIVAQTRKDWRNSYSSLGTDIKNILDDISSSMIAKQIIAYDMSVYSSRAEAQTMLDVQDDIIREGITFLEKFKSNTIKEI